MQSRKTSRIKEAGVKMTLYRVLDEFGIDENTMSSIETNSSPVNLNKHCITVKLKYKSSQQGFSFTSWTLFYKLHYINAIGLI